ncbi:uncharacterized protein G2W53_035256 [Senna tora]|uniref:Uncharacterized protein n=1 Tax=Senna tora TaxID=362788 RepID=A0A834SSI6_9FABA|nr:uncharacterized protein G2W53_035256 [Senna tora]
MGYERSLKIKCLEEKMKNKNFRFDPFEKIKLYIAKAGRNILWSIASIHGFTVTFGLYGGRFYQS